MTYTKKGIQGIESFSVTLNMSTRPYFGYSIRIEKIQKYRLGLREVKIVDMTIKVSDSVVLTSGSVEVNRELINEKEIRI